MSVFITFEGCEGCGKSTQSRLLYRRLLSLSKDALLTHEPGGTKLGNRISYLLKWTKDVPVSPVAELLLFNASRANLIDEVIRPALDKGKIVLCDRFADSTIAYQGYGRELSISLVKSVCEAATRGLKPDLTILLDIPVEEGLKRKAVKGNHDHFEKADTDFHQRVREGYIKIASSEPERWFVVDASQAKGEINEFIWYRVSQLIEMN